MPDQASHPYFIVLASVRSSSSVHGREREAVSAGVWIDDALFARLDAWIGKHYRDRLAPADLADPHLLMESRTALDELTQILGLGSLYDFQR